MDNRSTEILKKLKQCLVKGSLRADAFPKEDILQMLQSEYNGWLNEQICYLEEYITIYEMLIKGAIEKDNPAVLSDLLDELADDICRIPSETPAQITRVRNRMDDLIIEKFKQNAKGVYAHYPFFSTSGQNAFQGRGVVYTVITGDYDILQEPEHVCPEFDYICYTDNKSMDSQVWQIRSIENPDGLDGIRLARKHKILCHKMLPEYDYSIYVDGKIQIVGNIQEYIEKYSKGSPMLCFPHPARQCAYKEAEACNEKSKDDPLLIGKQMDGYRQEGYPANYGLIDSACLVRRHDDEKLQRVMECWWREVKEKSRRDQLSIGYACWKNDFHYDICDLFIYLNEYICKRRASEKNY